MEGSPFPLQTPPNWESEWAVKAGYGLSAGMGLHSTGMTQPALWTAPRHSCSRQLIPPFKSLQIFDQESRPRDS